MHKTRQRAAGGSERLDRKNVSIHTDLHRELKVASAHRGEDINHLIRRSWEAFKRSEGERLHRPVGALST